jgi:branched-chain amino acid aminotransferase
VLGGISQSIVFEIAPDRLPVVTVPIHVSDIPQVEEAFITSSSRGIVPVVEIDGHVFGEGSPRAMTQTLMKRYDAWVNEHLEDL